jgi:hypothetical protein
LSLVLLLSLQLFLAHQVSISANTRIKPEGSKGHQPMNRGTCTLQFKVQELSDNEGYVKLDIQHIEETHGNLSDKRHLEMESRDGMIKGLVWALVAK